MKKTQTLYFTTEKNWQGADPRPDLIRHRFIDVAGLVVESKLKDDNRLDLVRFLFDDDASVDTMKFFATYPEFMPKAIEIAPTISEARRKKIRALGEPFPTLAIRDWFLQHKPDNGEFAGQRSNYTGMVEINLSEVDNGTSTVTDFGHAAACNFLGLTDLMLIEARVDNLDQKLRFLWVSRGAPRDGRPACVINNNLNREPILGSSTPGEPKSAFRSMTREQAVGVVGGLPASNDEQAKVLRDLHQRGIVDDETAEEMMPIQQVPRPGDAGHVSVNGGVPAGR